MPSNALVADRLRQVPPAAWAAVLGFALTCACFYPGQLNPDAASSLFQGQQGIYFDWHPPLIAWTWRCLDRLLPGPGGMYLFQLLWVWAGLGLAVHVILGRRRAAWIAVLAIGLSPPLLAQAASIWKDLLMAGPLLLAWALLLLASRRWLAWPLALALPLLLFASAVRHNTSPALLPLAVWWALLGRARWCPERGRLLGWGAGLALWAVITAAGFGITRGLTDHKTHLHQHLFLFDLAGVSVRTDELLLPRYELAWHNAPQTVEELAQVYDPTSSIPLTQRPPHDPRLRPTADPAELAELSALWRYAIRRHPGAYLHHRWTVLRHALGLHGGRAIGAFRPIESEGAVAPLHGSARSLLEALSGTALFRGWPYLLLVAGLLGVLARRPASGWRRAGLALGASALLYVAPFALVINATELRYLYWPVLAGLVLTVLVATRGRVAEGPRVFPGS
jgi:hypothetical protein